MTGGRDDVERAARVLSAAFEVARARGYPPGSWVMRELEAAEQAFRTARRRWRAGHGLIVETPEHNAGDMVRPAVVDLRTRPGAVDGVGSGGAGSTLEGRLDRRRL